MLAFSAMLQTAAAKPADLALATRDGSVEVYAPNTEKPRLDVALIAYVVVVHVLAAMTIHRWWRWLVPTRGAGVPYLRTARHAVSQREQAKIDDRKGAVELLTEFKNDALREMCRDRRKAVFGRKSDLVDRLLETSSRANDSQMSQILRLRAGNHRLVVQLQDLDSVDAATAWLRTATADQPRQRT